MKKILFFCLLLAAISKCMAQETESLRIVPETTDCVIDSIMTTDGSKSYDIVYNGYSCLMRLNRIEKYIYYGFSTQKPTTANEIVNGANVTKTTQTYIQLNVRPTDKARCVFVVVPSGKTLSKWVDIEGVDILPFWDSDDTSKTKDPFMIDGTEYTMWAMSAFYNMSNQYKITISEQENINNQEDEVHTYTVNFSEPISADAMFVIVTKERIPGLNCSYIDNGLYQCQYNIPVGATKASVTVKNSDEKVYVYFAAQTPPGIVIKGMSASITTGSATPISAPTLSQTSTGTMYNIAGQRINTPNGIYIKDGKKHFKK